MKAIFADTSYYLALVSRSDVHHAEAIRLSPRLRCRITVTEFVLQPRRHSAAGADRD